MKASGLCVGCRHCLVVCWLAASIGLFVWGHSRQQRALLHHDVQHRRGLEHLWVVKDLHEVRTPNRSFLSHAANQPLPARAAAVPGWQRVAAAAAAASAAAASAAAASAVLRMTQKQSAIAPDLQQPSSLATDSSQHGSETHQSGADSLTGSSNAKAQLQHSRGAGVPGSSKSSSNSAAVPSQVRLLAPVLDAATRARSDPAYRAKLQQAAAAPINIAVMTGLFWQLPLDHTQNCQVDGIPLNCNIQNGGTEDYLDKVDALYYHVPSFGGKPRPKAFTNQLRLAMSLESAAYYPSLDNPSYMCHFDAEMTYRTCAQVTNWYSLESFDKLFDLPPVPFEEKLHAIAYINSNCAAQSGRSDIMRKLMALGDRAEVPVHSLGHCDNNTPWPAGDPNKVAVMHRYKFCVAMENSVRQDYLTEKMWDALMAGCIPVYMGSSNAPQIIPDPGSVIMYDPSAKAGNASTPEQLDALMHQIGSSKQRYEAMLAWKHKQPEQQPNEVFRYLWGVRHTTGECFLCQFLARHRAEPRPHYKTCLFNKEWMDAAGQSYAPEEQFCRQQPQPS